MDAESKILKARVRVLEEALRGITRCPDGKSKTWPQIVEIARAALSAPLCPKCRSLTWDGVRCLFCGHTALAAPPEGNEGREEGKCS